MSTKSIDQEILKKIRERQVTMHPTRHFLVPRVCSVVLLALFALFLVLLASFILYAFHRTGVLYLPMCGSAAFGYLLHPFSWFTGALFFGGLVLVFLFGCIICKTAKFYCMPLLIILLIFGTAFMAFGALVFMSPLHSFLKSFSERHDLTIVKSLYNTATRGTETHTATGIVRESTPDGFELVTLSKKIIAVRIDGSTTFQKDYMIHDNDAVIVVGNMSGTMMTAGFVHRSPAPLSAEETRELSAIDVNEDASE